MPNINALIARGGGYQPPSFDYGALQERRAMQETRGLQNQLLQQQIEAQPEQQRLQQMRMQLQGDLLSLREKALELAKKGELKPISTQITAGGETYELSGPPGAVAEVSGQFAQHMDHLDENAIPWAASQGVGIKKVEPKDPVRGTPEYLEAYRAKKEIEAEFRPPDKPTDREQKIQQIMEAYGVDKAKATRIAVGTIRPITDPITGLTTLVDIGSGEQWNLTERGAEPVQPTPEPRRRDISLYEAAEKGTGLWSTMMDVGSKISGLARGPIAEEHIEARQTLTMAQRNLFRALRESSKVLAFEMKTIFEEHPIDPSLWRSPEIARANFRVIDQFIRNRIADAERAAKDQTLPASARKDAKDTLKAMKDFIEVLDVPQIKADLTEDDEVLIQKYLRD